MTKQIAGFMIGLIAILGSYAMGNRDGLQESTFWSGYSSAIEDTKKAMREENLKFCRATPAGKVVPNKRELF